MYCIQHFICRPSDFTVSEDAGIEPMNVATSALAVSRSDHTAQISSTIHNYAKVRKSIRYPVKYHLRQDPNTNPK